MTTFVPVAPRAAASVILLRAGAEGPEILYLRRNPALRFHGDYWVFPGGRIDAADYASSRGDARGDEERAARQAAVREAHEEAGLHLPVTDLTFAVHWTTPTESPIRFATWFFAARAPVGTVVIDGQEIHAHRWLKPSDALVEHARGGLKLAAPTFALTTRLSAYETVHAALAGVADWPPERLLGRVHEVPGGRVALYAEDAAYGSGRIEEGGPRHRLWMLAGGWRYERRF